jgi:hypothetical protein
MLRDYDSNEREREKENETERERQREIEKKRQCRGGDDIAGIRCLYLLTFYH